MYIVLIQDFPLNIKAHDALCIYKTLFLKILFTIILELCYIRVYILYSPRYSYFSGIQAYSGYKKWASLSAHAHWNLRQFVGQQIVGLINNKRGVNVIY